MKKFIIVVALLGSACGPAASGQDMVVIADMAAADALSPDLTPGDVYLMPCAGGNDCANLSASVYPTFDDSVGGETAVVVRLAPPRPLTTKRLTFTACSDKAVKILYRTIPAEQASVPHFADGIWLELAATFQPFVGNNVVPFVQEVSSEEHLIISFVLLVGNPDKGSASCIGAFKPTQITMHTPPFDYIDVCRSGDAGAAICTMRPRAELGGNFALTHTMMSVVAN